MARETDATGTDEGEHAGPEPGDRVEVRTRFDRSWARGFTVAETTAAGFLVRRLSDGEVLPVEFGADEVRRERTRGTWWF